MKRKTLYTVLFALCLIAFWVVENFYTPSTYSNPNGPENVEFNTDFLPSSTTGEVVHHKFYSLSYNEPFEQAEWVVYELKKSQLTYDDRKRPYFIEDPKVSTKSADWRNYRGSGYDRGHLCPAGDRRFSEQAYNETFYTSNISPQDKDFNAGVWNRLEQQVRKWCKKYGDLVVVTGGVLENGLEEIGEEDVDVPKAFYKIVLKKNEEAPEVLAFLIPATESDSPLQRFLVSVDDLEEKTGIDFFHNQPEAWQEVIEKRVETSGWKF
ncbi:DNA/RNA non-specific endonuclease [Allomuricauda sp. M10]|uniref:DNA/RNA non-specific endonuclease n=1 Tax=Allomuricauda sp. M10 TaxID=2683292 RepID=UPI001D19001C|nr:DNA/RNA non-specific endonuclease [Muricauda sp. M10]